MCCQGERYSRLGSRLGNTLGSFHDVICKVLGFQSFVAPK